MEYLFLGLAIALVLGFEFVNGFHDTANAVATVIYTNTLKPVYAVVWSGLWNLLGVLTSSGTVAFAIVSLLPADLMVNDASDSSLVMVLALLISAIIWNLGTWYLGLPVSSTHSLIGAITGIAIAHSLLSLERNWWDGINVSKMQEVLVSLLVSPLLGFCGAVILFLISKALFQREDLYSPPSEKEHPLWIRAVLVLTCTGVSFAHGSNDGQKGVGLMMLILIVFLPSLFALNLDTSPQAIARLVATSNSVIPIFEAQISGTIVEASSDELIANSRAELTKFLQPEGQLNENIWRSLISESQNVHEYLSQSNNLRDIAIGDRRQVRNDLYLMSMAIGKIGKIETPTKLANLPNLPNQDVIIDFKNQLDHILKFIPYWVKVAIAIALGLGTMIGWQRVVVTVGEKIGTEHLNYAQGATSEMVTMTAIATANYFGLPVSTTHILSSGIAGTMVANRAGLQIDTVKKLLLAWVLTLPSCIFLGFITYAIGLFVIHH